MRHWFQDRHLRSLLKNTSYLAVSKVVAGIGGLITIAFAGRSLGALVPDRLMLLAGRDLEVLVYPSDVAISGTKAAMARARAAIASRLTEAP